jgi:hypothetical protein
VLSTSLYVFPCLHAFHSGCLCSHVISRTADIAARRNIERLELATKVTQLFPVGLLRCNALLLPIYCSFITRLRHPPTVHLLQS